MTGGKTSSSTTSGAIRTAGSPGRSANATPVITNKMDEGMLIRTATTATAAIAISSNTRICRVAIIFWAVSVQRRSGACRGTVYAGISFAKKGAIVQAPCVTNEDDQRAGKARRGTPLPQSPSVLCSCRRPVHLAAGFFLGLVGSERSEQLQRLRLGTRCRGAGQLVVIAGNLTEALNFLVHIQRRSPAGARTVTDGDAVAADDAAPGSILAQVEEGGAA